MEATNAAAAEAISKAASVADYIELRLDYLRERPDFGVLLAEKPRPIIATYRRNDQGGSFVSMLEPARVDILIDAAKAGADYVDIELVTDVELREKLKAEKGAAKLIVSWHSYASPPSRTRLRKIFEEELAAGADVCKIVWMGYSAEDSINAIELTAAAARKGKLVICFCMGTYGLLSRVATLFAGGMLTFASMDGKATAPGQLDVTEMNRLLTLFTTGKNEA